jgi:hypothetical protein
MTTNETKSEVNFIDKKEVMKLTGLSQMRINGAVRDGKLRSHMEPLNDTKTEHRMFDPADVAEWRANTATHSRRADGRGKFTMYATPEELEAVNKVLKANELEVPIQRANKVKATKAE